MGKGWDRLEATITAGNSWATESIARCPAKFLVRRVRAIPIPGSSTATQVAFKVHQDADDTKTHKVDIEYSLTDDYVDSAEEIYIECETLSSNKSTGTIWVSAKTDTVGPNEIAVILDIEVL